MTSITQLEGRTIEYLDGDQLKIALVEHEAKSKLQVVDERGRNESVPPSKVVLVHRDRPLPGHFVSFARELRSRIERAMDDIDIELLWQNIESPEREYPLEELAAVYFGEATPLHLSALFRVLQQDNFYFRRRNAVFSARSAQAVEELRQQHQRRREREAFREEAVAWIRRTLVSEIPVGIPKAFEEILDRAHDFLMRRPVGEIPQLLARATQELAGREAAYQLLVRTGRISADSDPLLVIAGIEERFRPKVEQAAETILPFEASPDRIDFSHLLSFSIDDDDTREIDDALTLEQADRGWRVGIHIADVSHFIAKGSPLDEEAQRRGATVYLPTCTLAMFPERLSHDLMSLEHGRLRPTLSFLATVDDQGGIHHFEVVRGMLAVTRRLTYEEADRLITPAEGSDAGSSHEQSETALASALRTLHRISKALSETRAQQGALIIRRPELKVHVAEGRVEIRTLNANAPSRMLVSEMMILANRLAARDAYTRDLPIIYRVQENTLDPQDERIRQLADAQTYDPLLFDRVLRNMRRSKLSLYPQPHAGLGLPAYTQLTSPIRRYADLVMQRQFEASIDRRPAPYEREELLEVIATAETVEREIRAIEQQSDRRWVLEYLKQEYMDRTLEGTVIDEAMRGFIVELDTLCVRGLIAHTHAHKPGDRVTVAIDSVDTEEGRLKLRETP
ncbi:MAG: RNB domain-containing ribonuclease [Acidobacteria bacterium]|nr:RNB domain-containing ribonuclease [Acidobacteriota bacterium]